MENNVFLQMVQGGIIVSCQALADEPLHGSDMMARMALAACQGGAVAIRCNSIQDLLAIRGAVALPIIGLIKQHYEGYAPYITPTMKEVDLLAEAGADVIAVDATERLHPGGVEMSEFIRDIKKRHRVPLLADISTLKEGILAEAAGADFVSSTLSGYTPYSPSLDAPDFQLIEALVGKLATPVFAEGRFWTPEEAAAAIALGAHSVIIGSAITRPKLITHRFVKALDRG